LVIEPYIVVLVLSTNSTQTPHPAQVDANCGAVIIPECISNCRIVIASGEARREAIQTYEL
jgi:hypothetical protein